MSANRLMTAIAGLATALALGAASPALAEPSHCPPGQAKKGHCVQQHQGKGAHKGKHEGKKHQGRKHDGKRPAGKRHDGKRPGARAAAPAAAAAGAATAVGSAVAAQQVTDRLRDDDALRLGETLGISRYHRVSDPALFGLPVPTDGSAYYVIGNRLVRADADLKMVEEMRVLNPQTDCPPGLAKKEPACIPPGQAKKLLRTGWDPARFTLIDSARYGLPAPEAGWDYYVLDNTILRVDRKTHEILSIVRQIDALL